MKFSEADLRQLFDPSLDITTKELCHQLTMLGLEVEDCEPIAPEFNGVYVGEILEAVQHPNADRLRVCQVNIGKEPLLTIVCGAPNARIGIKVAVSIVGACLPGNFKIKESALRGVTSQGMLCSEKELGLTETQDGILELPADAPLGQDIRDYLNLNDHIITINLTPNRGDCLSLYGIARELAVLNHMPVPQWTVDELPVAISTQPKQQAIEIAVPQACPRYLLAKIEGIDNQCATPLAMKRSLERAGIRSISPVVDILNYVMLMTGQPMHAFDASKVQGTLSVDFATTGESITLLNDAAIELRFDTLTIRDAQGPLALAGIMGGQFSAVEPTTQQILLESAYFAPAAIAGKARSYGLHTDSSHRFERGVDPNLAQPALLLAIKYLTQYVGGKVVEIIEKIDSNALPAAPIITLRDSKILKLLGLSLQRKFVLATLRDLGCSITNETAEFLQVSPPSFRFDLNLEEDLIEELARFVGYDHLPIELPKMALQQDFAAESVTPLIQVKNFFVASGWHEVVSYSFIDADLQNTFFAEAQYQLQNPISKELSSMRKSLLPSLLSILQYNVSRQQDCLSIFEMGKRFVGIPPLEEEILAGLWFGKPQGWISQTPLDFYDLKGVLQKLFKLTRLAVQFKTEALPDYVHPGQSQTLWLNGECIGYLGALHPKRLPQFDLKATPFVFELSTAIFKRGIVRQAQPVSKFPMIERDLAFLVDRSFMAEKLITAAKSVKSEILQEVFVFDVYAGERLSSQQKSIAIKLRLQAQDRTLMDTEVDALIDRVIHAIVQDGQASLREG